MSENDVSRSGSERKCEDAPLAQTSSSWLLELHRRCFSCCNVVLRQEALLHGGHDRAMVRALEDMLCSTQIYVLSRSVVCRLLQDTAKAVQTGVGQHAEEGEMFCSEQLVCWFVRVSTLSLHVVLPTLSRVFVGYTTWRHKDERPHSSSSGPKLRMSTPQSTAVRTTPNWLNAARCPKLLPYFSTVIAVTTPLLDHKGFVQVFWLLRRSRVSHPSARSWSARDESCLSSRFSQSTRR